MRSVSSESSSRDSKARWRRRHRAGFVEGDADEPGAEPGLRAKRMEVSESLQKGFLHDVLRFLWIAQERHGQGEDGALVGADEVMEEMRIAGEDGSDNLRLSVSKGRFAHRQTITRGTRSQSRVLGEWKGSHCIPSGD